MHEWDRVIGEVSVEAILYQGESLLTLLDGFEESVYPPQATRIRDVLKPVVAHVRDELRNLALKQSLTVEEEFRARRLGRVLQEIHSYVRFLQASDPAKASPAVQIALTELTRLFFPRELSNSEADTPSVTLVRPQWKYNLTYTPLTWYLRECLIPGELDPEMRLGANSADELIQKISENQSTSEKRASKLPTHLAILSFAGLDSHDTLLLPLLCHELGHFIDYARPAPPRGADTRDDQYLPYSHASTLSRASYVTEEKLQNVLASRGVSLPSRRDLIALREALLFRIDVCRREIFADLLAVRMLGLGYFVAQAELLKSVSTWSNERVTRSGYPAIAYRLSLILAELMADHDGYSVNEFLGEAGAHNDRNATSVNRLRHYLEAWQARLSDVLRSAQESEESIQARALTELASEAIERAVSPLRQAARERIAVAHVARLTERFFKRIDLLRSDIPPSQTNDTIERSYAEILSAAWAYQLLYGNAHEAERNADERFKEYQKTCRLVLKAIELAAFKSSNVAEQNEPLDLPRNRHSCLASVVKPPYYGKWLPRPNSVFSSCRTSRNVFKVDL